MNDVPYAQLVMRCRANVDGHEAIPTETSTKQVAFVGSVNPPTHGPVNHSASRGSLFICSFGSTSASEI